MGFYDNYNFDGLKFLSQIKTKPEHCISEPCPEFLSIIRQIKSPSPRAISVAEIGIGYGATALQVLKMLGEDDTYYCFDFESKLRDFVDDLQARDFGIKCQVVTGGNSSDDGYFSDLFMEFRVRHIKITIIIVGGKSIITTLE